MGTGMQEVLYNYQSQFFDAVFVTLMGQHTFRMDDVRKTMRFISAYSKYTTKKT